MMKATKINDHVHWIGANISTEDLFEGIWPIKNGVTINSYVVNSGEKVAIIDLVRDWGGAPSYLLDQLNSIGIDIKDVDYFVLNHIEPDHTGDLKTLWSMSNKAEIITTEKGKVLVEQFYGCDAGHIRTVKTGDELDLGNDMKLTFYEIPNVHWPETMATFDAKTGTLFSCDAFGSFGALKGSLFDDENSEHNHEFYERECLRYYANIVGPFSSHVLKAINALGPLDIKTICPSHGLVWRGDPARIVNRYARYANYMNELAEPKITVVWGSMYGNTEVMLRSILNGIGKENVEVEVFRVPQIDNSYILSSVWESAGVVFGMPTYEYSMYPPMAYTLDIIAKKRAKNKIAFRFGSFGWSGGAQKVFDEKIKNLNWDCLDPLDFQGHPSDEELEKGEKMGQLIAQKVKAIAPKLKEGEKP